LYIGGQTIECVEACLDTPINTVELEAAKSNTIEVVDVEVCTENKLLDNSLFEKVLG